MKKRSLLILCVVANSAVPLVGMHKFPRMWHTFKSARLYRPQARLLHPQQHKPTLHTHSKTQFKKIITPNTVNFSWMHSYWKHLNFGSLLSNLKRYAMRLFKPTALLSSAAVAASIAQRESATIWQQYAEGKEVTRQDLIDSFVQDCQVYKDHNNKIPEHKKNSSTVRIATYNIHGWDDPDGYENSKTIIDTIKNINPDIIVLQEAATMNPGNLQTFNELGYKFFSYGNTLHPEGWKFFGNIVMSKYPITKGISKTYDADMNSNERRCFVETNIVLPNNKTITLYGTHLDVWDSSGEKRDAEISELVQHTQSKSGNILIGADFNAVRPRDYQYQVKDTLVWDLLSAAHTKRTGIPVPTKAHECLEQADFSDSFTRAGIESPRFTVWNGTSVDFLYLNKEWNLPIKGSYVYYSSASDHLPVIMDVDCA